LATWARGGDSAGLTWTLPNRDCDLGLILDGVKHLDRQLEAVVSAEETLTEYEFRATMWNPYSETRAECIRRVLQKVKRDLEAVLDRTEHLCQAVGLEKTPRVTAREHFDWLVLYQVQGVPFSQIGQRENPTREPQSIADGVKTAAAHVIGPGWERWLRPGRPGRPRKI